LLAECFALERAAQIFSTAKPSQGRPKQLVVSEVQFSARHLGVLGVSAVNGYRVFTAESQRNAKVTQREKRIRALFLSGVQATCR
jgi:hypothetical protein